MARSIPLGAFFAEDLHRTAVQAARAARATYGRDDDVARPVAEAVGPPTQHTASRVLEGPRAASRLPQSCARAPRTLGSPTPRTRWAFWCAARQPDDVDAAIETARAAAPDLRRAPGLAGGIVCRHVSPPMKV